MFPPSADRSVRCGRKPGFPPPVAGWQLPLLDCMGVQPGAIGDSRDGLRYLTAIWPNAAAAGGIVTIGRAAEI